MICLLPTATRAEVTSEVIGVILELEGTGSIQRDNLPPAPAGIDIAVKQNDILSTGPSSRMFIQFIDGTEITLSENAEFVAEDYMYDASDTSNSGAIYNVTKGAFYYLSGLISKNNPTPDVTINVPQGSIGIRGTEFWGGDIDGAYGILVNSGVVSVSNDAGSQVLAEGQGTNLKARNVAPTEPKIWPKAKTERAVKTIALANPKKVAVKKKISAGRTQALSEKHQAHVQKRMQSPTSARDKARVAKRIRILNKTDDGATNNITPETIKKSAPVLDNDPKGNNQLDRLRKLQQLNQKQQLSPGKIQELRQRQLQQQLETTPQKNVIKKENKATILNNQLNNALGDVKRPLIRPTTQPIE